ncbi:MAG: GNAT family N-acetyltransferase [Bifidobacteriaceae bacterium]|jgi:GNAT superfamily N-acetyltransferase|nr:GNAT family N-acetyltransferase [Bifidobacteriaceae bacterium]
MNPPGDEIRVYPASADRFDDLATMLAPKNPAAFGCWCLSYRIAPRINQRLSPEERRSCANELTTRPVPPGVLAYQSGVVVGWAAVAPRQQVHALTHNTHLPLVDVLPVWSIWCIKVRPGHRGQGITRGLILGAVEFARSHGAPAIEAYPVDNAGKRIDTTLAFIGTRSMFESAGFAKIADTESTSARIPRIIMRRELS